MLHSLPTQLLYSAYSERDDTIQHNTNTPIPPPYRKTPLHCDLVLPRPRPCPLSHNPTRDFSRDATGRAAGFPVFGRGVVSLVRVSVCGVGMMGGEGGGFGSVGEEVGCGGEVEMGRVLGRVG